MGSLAIALGGSGEDVVVASDLLGYTGDLTGYYKFDFGEKFREASGRNWIFAFAGNELGELLFDEAMQQDPPVSTNIRHAARELAARTLEIYRGYTRPKETTELMLAGVQSGRAEIHTWHLETGDAGALKIGPEWHPKFAAIGTRRHGGLYLANSLLTNSMSVERKVLLAYFSVKEVGKHDPRVRGIKVAAATQDRVVVFTDSDLSGVSRRAEEISARIRDEFLLVDAPDVGRWKP